ncbi:MAG: ATP-grasp domain-containing protein [bacterium]|nr:ATP-grasp domain-containing protein [bacterium]
MNAQTSNGVNILIASAGREVPLIKEFKKALKSSGGKIIAFDINPLSAGFQFSDISYIVPRYKEASFIPSVLAICKKHRISLLIPTKDAELPIFAKARKRFEKIGVRIMVASLKTINICWDKSKFIDFCISHGFSAPKTYDRRNKKTNYRFPLFINNRFGLGSRHAYKIHNRNELNFFLKYVPTPLVQEYVDWKEYTIDLFADFNGRIISVVPRERISIFGGESFVGKTYKNTTLIRGVIKLAEALHLIGHNTIQCFFDGKNIKFIEVNPRYGGGSPLSFASGVSTPAYLVRLVRGQKVPSRIGAFKDNLVMLRYTQDIYKDAKSITWKKIK